MKYILDLFTPATWDVYCNSDKTVTGFRHRLRRVARERVEPNDVFLCYLTRLSRWCGALKVEALAYHDEAPLFEDPDPYVVRFKVSPIVVLEPRIAIPVYTDCVWESLSITSDYEKTKRGWTGFFRQSLNLLTEADGEFLLDLLKGQQEAATEYPLSDRDRRYLLRPRVRSVVGLVEVEIPDEDDDQSHVEESPVSSYQMQAKVAEIGVHFGFRIWIPKRDKREVLKYIPEVAEEHFLPELPLNYDDNTLLTIEQIDILWIKGRSIVRAFEIEHTTAIYSGLLRMADLLALQPNMDIRLHIVAPDERRSKVLTEIRRPVFSLLERGPLYKQCTYLSYESIAEIGNMPNLEHIKDSILGQFEEMAET